MRRARRHPFSVSSPFSRARLARSLTMRWRHRSRMSQLEANLAGRHTERVSASRGTAPPRPRAACLTARPRLRLAAALVAANPAPHLTPPLADAPGLLRLGLATFGRLGRRHPLATNRIHLRHLGTVVVAESDLQGFACAREANGRIQNSASGQPPSRCRRWQGWRAWPRWWSRRESAAC